MSTTTAETPTATTHAFEAEVSEVLRLVIHSLYTDREIFVRELISNASDALDKLRFRALTEPQLTEDDSALRIRILVDSDAGTLTIWDNGVGMTRDELVSHLGTVARSGTRAFAEALAQANQEGGASPQLIGQFGVGFYASFLVADEVQVISRAAGSAEAWSWRSDGKQSFTLEPAERETRGTSVVLRLQEEHKGFLDRWRLRRLVERFSDYIAFPIEMARESSEEDADGEPAMSKEERINQEGALWQRDPKEVSEEQYAAFYRHVTGSWDEPLAHLHFAAEGQQNFKGVLFLPGQPPFDLFDPEAKRGLRLYVRRVFVLEDCAELVPKWLRFLRGVIDADDLPLNVSRETLQDSKQMERIRNYVTRKALEMIATLAEDKPEAYETFWKHYGRVLKEGLFQDVKQRERLAKLARFATLKHEKPVGLAQLLSERPEGQSALYYAMGPQRGVLEHSPQLEGLRSRGYDVILLTDNVDPWAIEGIPTFDEVPLVNAMQADLELEPKSEGQDEESEGATPTPTSEADAAFFERLQAALGERVSAVRASKRLTDSPACLVLPEHALPAHIERLLRANQEQVPVTKRILEVHLAHPILTHLRALGTEGDEAQTFETWAALLYDQALLSEGAPIDDPAGFSKRLQALMVKSLSPG